MAVNKKNGKLPSPRSLAEVIMQGVNQLLTRDNHQNLRDALELLDEAEGGSLRLNMPVVVDCSESAPQITIDLGYTKSYKDRRVLQMEDPDQANFHFVDQNKAARVDPGDEDLTGGRGAPADNERVVLTVPAEGGESAPKKRGRKKKS